MKILSLELSLYKRLSLNRINYIKITPESKIQLILGTNGSGKSSVLKEMTPLPATPADYDKGGFKVIEILHKNNHYVLKSIFHQTGNKFHFIENGIDLMGDGGTSTVYKELVKQIFNITADVHELMTGNLKFTEMDTSKRRSWLTRFSDADYTYAIQYYSRLKKKLSGTTEAIKLFEGRLMQESDKLLKPEEEAKYREDIRVLNETLAYFLELKTPVDKSYDQVVKDIGGIDLYIDNLTRVLLRNRNLYMKREEKFTSMADIDRENIQVQADIQTIQNQIDALFKVIDQQQKTLETLRSSDLQSMEDIDKSIDSIGPQIYDEQKKLRLIGHIGNDDLKFDDPVSAVNALTSIAPQLNDVLIAIGKNEDKKFSRQAFIDASEHSKILHLKIEVGNKTISDLEVKQKELEHIKTHDETVCPKCEHKWFRGFSEKEYKKTIADKEGTQEVVKMVSEQLRLNDLYLDEARQYLELYRSYSLITQATKILEPFWDLLLKSDVIFNNPRYIMTMVDDLKEDLNILMKIDSLKTRMKECLDLKMIVSKNQAVNASNLTADMEKNEKDLYTLNQTLQVKNKRLQQLVSVKKILNQIDEDKKRLQEYLNMRDQNVSKLTDLMKREILNECIASVRKELIEREQIISRISIQKALVLDITNQISELQETAGVLGLAVKELSPSEGLIAKGLIGFINHYTSQINGFIKKVWLYPMEITPIIPSAEDDVELDYKFEVKVNDDYIVSDISKTSSGMKEVIDLAFRVVSMQYVGQLESPLYLDEFAKTFDESHRRAAFDMIVNISNASNFSQVFMISHYDEIHGNLSNTDVLVMCDKNLTLNKGSLFNRHVVMN